MSKARSAISAQFRFYLLLALFWGLGAAADNSEITSLWNQWQMGKYCGAVRKDEIRTSNFACSVRAQKILKELKLDASDVLEEIVFREAAQNQVLKNQCLTERIDLLSKDKAKRNQWLSYMAAAWLGRKKSELILKKCTREFFYKMDSALVQRYGLEKAYAMAREHGEIFAQPFHQESDDVIAKWKPICLNADTVRALQAAPELFNSVTPIISSPELFDDFEAAREVMINKKTGKPITDADLLNADLSDLSFLKLNANDKLLGKVGRTLLDISADRRKVAANIKQGTLDTEVKDYLYEDGTASEVMVKAGLVDKDTGKPKTNGAACVMARYEPSAAGGLVEIGVTSVAGGLFGVALKGAGLLKAATKIGAFKRGLGFGVMATMLAPMPKQVLNCFSNIKYANKVDDLGASDIGVAIQSSDLPPEVAYERWNMQLDEKSIPSCASAGEKNLAINSQHDANCARELAVSLPWAKIALPAAIILH